MAFDGITVASLVSELSKKTEGTRINKISQPESDELLLTIKGNSETFRVLLSCDATLPLVYITDENKPSPLNAPPFCMLLRKHLANAKIISVTQPSLERIIRFELEHLDEMGDLCRKFLIIELMGKYSNIIFTDDSGKIIDSIKHVSHNISSVREVLPGREYFVPDSMDKLNPLQINVSDFKNKILSMHHPVSKALYLSFTGLSPLISEEICYMAKVPGDSFSGTLTDNDLNSLFIIFSKLMDKVKNSEFTPAIYYEKNVPKDYAPIPLSIYKDYEAKNFDTMSGLIKDYYMEKAILVRIREKSTNLRSITQTALSRNVKKLDLQRKQLLDTEKKDIYKLYGELLNAYGYSLPAGEKSCRVLNYYTNEEITIPLDKDLTPLENAKKYFDKYGKLKRTAANLTGIIEEVSAEVSHLESIMTALDIAVLEEDLREIRNELAETGYIKHKTSGKKEKITSKPFHYISSDGFHIYVGKNNYQNDKLTFEFANGNDWWFHAKKMPGSHVIIRTEGNEVPDRTFEEAARLAAYYSSGRGSDRVEIDYTLKKNVKKPAGSKPGFVVYYTNFSMVIDDNIKEIKSYKE